MNSKYYKSITSSLYYYRFLKILIRYIIPFIIRPNYLKHNLFRNHKTILRPFL